MNIKAVSVTTISCGHFVGIGLTRLRILMFWVVCLGNGMTGCATGSSTGVSDLVAEMRAATHFEEAASHKDWDAANQIYGRHKAKLDSVSPRVVAQAGQSVADIWAPKLAAARQTLERLVAQPGTSTQELAVAVSQAREVLVSYRRLPLWQPDKPPEAAALEATWSDAALAAFIEPRFSRYDHARQPLFFIGLSTAIVTNEIRKRVVLSQIRALIKAVTVADEAKGSELIKGYSQYLSRENQVALEHAYLQRSTSERVGPLTYDQLLSMSRASREAGLREDPVRAVRLVGDTVSGPVSLNGRLVEETVIADALAAAVEQAAKEGKTLLLVIDTSNAVTVPSVVDARLESRRKQTGTVPKLNPEYAQAQSDLAKAEANLQEARRLDTQAQTQARQLAGDGTSGTLGALAAVFGSVMGTSNFQGAQREVDEAKERLASTPKSLNEPVFGNQQVMSAVQSSTYLQHVLVYAIDTKTKMFRRAVIKQSGLERKTIDGNDLASFTVISSRHVDVVPNLNLGKLGPALQSTPNVPFSRLGITRDIDRSSFERESAHLLMSSEKISRDTSARVAALAPPPDKGLPTAPAGRDANEGVISGPKVGRGENASSCPTSFAALDRKLPHFAAPELEKARTSIVQQELMAPLREWKAAGKPLSDLVDEAMASAKHSDEEIRNASECAASTSAFGGTAEEFEAAVNNGQLNRLSDCNGGINTSCMCAALLSKLNSIAMRAFASAVQCHSRTMGP